MYIPKYFIKGLPDFHPVNGKARVQQLCEGRLVWQVSRHTVEQLCFAAAKKQSGIRKLAATFKVVEQRQMLKAPPVNPWA